MKPSLDRALRIVWLVIGVLLLGTLLVSLVFVAAGFLRTRGAGEAADRAVAEGVAGEAGGGVRLTLPQAMRGTDTRIAFVAREGGRAARAPEPGRVQGVVNVVFLDADGAARLLLDRPAEIREVHFPAAGVAEEGMEGWITYEIGSGGEVGLYLSDLTGRALRPVAVPPLRYLAHRPFGAGRLLVSALDGDPPRQRAFLYDPEAGSLEPFTALDSVADEAGRIAAP
jgi:hypothetical protein